MPCNRKVGLAGDADPTFFPPSPDRIFKVTATMPSGGSLTAELVVRLDWWRSIYLAATGTVGAAILYFKIGGVWRAIGPAVEKIPPGAVFRLPTGDITALTRDQTVQAFIRLIDLSSTDGADGVNICWEQGTEVSAGGGETEPAETSCSPVLEASRILLPGPGVLYACAGSIDSTCPTGRYYLQLIDSAAPVDMGNPVVLLAQVPVDQVLGRISYWDLSAYIPPQGVQVTDGAVVQLSTSLGTGTLAGAYLLAGGGP